MDVKDEIRKTLEGMGVTIDEVAITLRAKGVQGVRNAARYLNPVVRYVQNTLRNDNLDLDVMTGKTIRLKGGSAVGMQEVTLPEAVRLFIDAFNRGTYPDLELPPDKK